MTEASIRLCLTMGDPAGIGPEILLKALLQLAPPSPLSLTLVGQPAAFEPGLRQLKHSWEQLQQSAARREIALEFVSPEPQAGETLLPEIAAVRWSTEQCLQGLADGLVTAPLSKESCWGRGFRFPGHTEFIGQLCGVDRPVMGFMSPRLCVSLATIHVPLKDVPGLLNEALLLHTIRTSWLAVRDWLGIDAPRVAVCGLNPHAGENGHLGTEDQAIILPAIERARAEGMDVSGPLPGDTVFGKAARGDFDWVVAMYHDQGLIPIKVLDFGSSVNVTLGLPVLRTSVDHGVAYDIAGKGLADPSSMLAAITLAHTLASTRARAQRP